MLSLGVGGVQPLPPGNNIPENPTSQSFLFPNRPYQAHRSFYSNRVTQLGFCTILGQIRNGSCAFAVKSPRKGSDILLKMEDLDLDDDYEEEVEEEGDDDDDDEDIVVPIRNMKIWLENKPPGFGEGKEYDTSIEDKLAEEMEQSRLAQLANINKLKNNPQNTNSKKEQLQKQKVSEAVPSGIPVRLVNLPKKKNIQRDLQQAFKGVQGIINIVPVVSGNKKTREPVCKGIAFVYFKSKDEANRFIQIFSRQSIAFGKIQKQIKYEMMNSSSPKPASEKSVDSDHSPRVAETSVENDLDADSDMENPSFNTRGKTVSGEYDSEDDEHVSTVREDKGENFEKFSIVEASGDDDSRVLKEESLTNSLSSKQQEKSRAKKKKLMVKKKGSAPKLNIPGSANRLKIKEKAVLTDVFSKYGPKVDITVKEHN